MKVTNINGTSEYDCSCGSWLKHWEKFNSAGQSKPYLCPAWFDSVSDKLEELHNYVWKKVKVPIEGGLFSEIDIDKIEEEHKIKMGLSKKKRISK